LVLAETSFQMFVKKLVAVLLLAIYGIPSAIGPHWHHHQHAVEVCSDQPSSVSACCCHHREVVVAKTDDVDGGTLLAQADTPDAGGLCTVCQFYASASLQVADARLPVCSLLSHAVTALPERLLLPTLRVCNVRGPPSLLA